MIAALDVSSDENYKAIWIAKGNYKILICTEANDSKQILNGSLPCFSS